MEESRFVGEASLLETWAVLDRGGEALWRAVDADADAVEGDKGKDMGPPIPPAVFANEPFLSRLEYVDKGVLLEGTLEDEGVNVE